MAMDVPASRWGALLITLDSSDTPTVLPSTAHLVSSTDAHLQCQFSSHAQKCSSSLVTSISNCKHGI